MDLKALSHQIGYQLSGVISDIADPEMFIEPTDNPTPTTLLVRGFASSRIKRLYTQQALVKAEHDRLEEEFRKPAAASEKIQLQQMIMRAEKIGEFLEWTKQLALYEEFNTYWHIYGLQLFSGWRVGYDQPYNNKVWEDTANPHCSMASHTAQETENPVIG